MFKKQNKNSGMVLLLAMLIIAATLSTAAIFGNLIIREIRHSRLIDQSIQAYYLAESGAERALYRVRQEAAVIDCSNTFCCDIDNDACKISGYCNDGAPCIISSKGDLALVGDLNLSVNNEQETIVDLREGQSFQLDLFNPYQGCPTEVDQKPGVEQIEVESLTGDLSLYGQLTNLSYIVCSSPSLCFNPPIAKPVTGRDFISATPKWAIVGLDDVNIDSNCSYTFRLTLPFDQIDDNEVTGRIKIILSKYNGGSQVQMPIPSRLLIESNGIYGNSNQRVVVRTPVRPPVAGLYDFVLFSEEQIIKQ